MCRISTLHLEVFAIYDRPRCTKIDAEALQSLRRFFGILAQWDESDRPGKTTNPGVANDAVGDNLFDGLEYQQGASCGNS